jgi:hypothetical protein
MLLGSMLPSRMRLTRDPLARLSGTIDDVLASVADGRPAETFIDASEAADDDHDDPQ